MTFPRTRRLPAGGCTIIVIDVDLDRGPADGASAVIDPATRRQLQAAASPYTGRYRARCMTFTVSTVGSGNLYISFKQPGRVSAGTDGRPRVPFPDDASSSYSQFVTSNGDLSYDRLLRHSARARDVRAGRHHDGICAQDRVTYYTSTPSLLKPSPTSVLISSTRSCAPMAQPWDPATDSWRTSPASSDRTSSPRRAASPVQVAGAPGRPGIPERGRRVQARRGRIRVSPTISTASWRRVTSSSRATTRRSRLYVRLHRLDYREPHDRLHDHAGRPVPRPTHHHVVAARAATSCAAGFDFLVYGIPQNCDDAAGVRLQLHQRQRDDVHQLGVWMDPGRRDGRAELRLHERRRGHRYAEIPARSSVWYGMPPVQYPFGQARAVN